MFEPVNRNGPHNSIESSTGIILYEPGDQAELNLIISSGRSSLCCYVALCHERPLNVVVITDVIWLLTCLCLLSSSTEPSSPEKIGSFF